MSMLGCAYFYLENIIFLFYKTRYHNEEVNSIEPSPSVRVPCLLQGVENIDYLLNKAPCQKNDPKKFVRSFFKCQPVFFPFHRTKLRCLGFFTNRANVIKLIFSNLQC
jgi:hypothetical protein